MLMNGTEGRVWAEIYLDNLVENYKIIKNEVKNAHIMAAIKADAYGHGAVEVARILENEGIAMFGVASVEEGIELRQAGITTPILILSPILYSQIETALQFHLIPTVSEMKFFRALEKKVKKLGTPIIAHVEIDTGMTRTGFPYESAKRSLRAMAASKYVKIDGIFSHFPVADGNGTFTKKQIRDFGRLVKSLPKTRIHPTFLHLANSSGIFKHAYAHLDLVRPGIALYGLASSPDIHYARGLKPLMALKSRVVNTRTVKANVPISYGHTFITKRRSRIATVSVGYGDGYPRSLSNRADALIMGQRVPIVGTVCMDLIMIDITDVPGVKINDIVTLIGRDGKAEVTADECAQKSNTIVYEITSGIGPRVARVYKYKNKCISVRNLLGRWRYAG
jgi:alanine racemase